MKYQSQSRGVASAGRSCKHFDHIFKADFCRKFLSPEQKHGPLEDKLQRVTSPAGLRSARLPIPFLRFPESTVANGAPPSTALRDKPTLQLPESSALSGKALSDTGLAGTHNLLQSDQFIADRTAPTPRSLDGLHVDSKAISDAFDL